MDVRFIGKKLALKPGPLGQRPLLFEDRKGIGTLGHDRYLRRPTATLLIGDPQGLLDGSHAQDTGFAGQIDVFFTGNHDDVP